MAEEKLFDHCPGCKYSTFFHNQPVYKCPACFRFFCKKCIDGNIVLGYKCPNCTLHIAPHTLEEYTVGHC